MLMNASGQRSVLIVEDDEDLRSALEMLLDDDGFEVACAEHGAVALRLLESIEPDVILLDLNMPRMDGRQVLGEVKSDEDLRTIPIVVLTTSNADTDIVGSYTLQANAYVTKPIDLDDFNDVVRRIDEFFGRVVVLPKRS